MVDQGEYLQLKLDNVVIKKGGMDFTIPLSDISIIILEGLNTVVSTRLLNALSDYNIALITCNNSHSPNGIFTSLNGHSRASKLLKEQMMWSDETKDLFWQRIVRMKLSNQAAVLEYFGKEDHYISKLYEYIEQIKPGDSTNREGHAAKIYFNSLFKIDFTRDDENNVVNSCLNYGYAIFRAYLARLTVGYGLVGLLGLFHKNEFNHFNLTDDLMEPFRQFIDSFVYENFMGCEYLTFEMRQKLVDLLNQTIQIDGKKSQMRNVMENYVVKFIQAIKMEDPELMVYPDIKGVLIDNGV